MATDDEALNMIDGVALEALHRIAHEVWYGQTTNPHDTPAEAAYRQKVTASMQKIRDAGGAPDVSHDWM